MTMHAEVETNEARRLTKTLADLGEKNPNIAAIRGHIIEKHRVYPVDDEFNRLMLEHTSAFVEGDLTLAVLNSAPVPV